MDRILEAAKAVVTAVCVAIVGALAGIDWGAVVGAAVGSGGLTYATPNKKRKRR